MFHVIVLHIPGKESVTSRDVQSLLSSVAMHCTLYEMLRSVKGFIDIYELNCYLLTRKQVNMFRISLQNDNSICKWVTNESAGSQKIIAFINLKGECAYWMFWGYSLYEFRTILNNFYGRLPRNLNTNQSRLRGIKEEYYNEEL